MGEDGQTYNFSSDHARDVILVSISRFLGMGNPLGPFSNASDWPEWPNRHLWPFMATQNMVRWGKMAKLITLVLIMLETDFGVYPQFFGHGKSIGTIFKHLRLA